MIARPPLSLEVTAAGGELSRMVVHRTSAARLGGCTLVSDCGGLWSILSPDAPLELPSADRFNVFWAGIAVVMTFAAFLVCFERPRPRREERFGFDAPTEVLQPFGKAPVRLLDLSVSGALVEGLPQDLGPEGQMAIDIPHVGAVPCAVVRRRGGRSGVKFLASQEQHNGLIQLLFSEPPHNIATTGRFGAALLSLCNRAIRALASIARCGSGAGSWFRRPGAPPHRRVLMGNTVQISDQDGFAGPGLCPWTPQKG